jgi:serine protease Do
MYYTKRLVIGLIDISIVLLLLLIVYFSEQYKIETRRTALYKNEYGNRQAQPSERLPLSVDPDDRTQTLAEPTMPDVYMRSKKSADSFGTAFTMNTRGYWLTAKHVVHNCTSVYLEDPREKDKQQRRYGAVTQKNGDKLYIVPAKVIRMDDNADQALLAVNFFMPNYLAINHENNLIPNKQRGFAIGFPAGKAGQVSTTYLGKLTAIFGFASKTVRHSALAWSINDFSPTLTDFGGISGGPIVNEYGRVLGINSGSSGAVRRGRFITSTPQSVYNFSKEDLEQSSGKEFFLDSQFSEENFSENANILRQKRMVVRVFCKV